MLTSASGTWQSSPEFTLDFDRVPVSKEFRRDLERCLSRPRGGGAILEEDRRSSPPNLAIGLEINVDHERGADSEHSIVAVADIVASENDHGRDNTSRKQQLAAPGLARRLVAVIATGQAMRGSSIRRPSRPCATHCPAAIHERHYPQWQQMRELRWYLENFLDYPFPPETDHAGRVRGALRRWGEQVFDALFGSREAGRLFDAATAADYARLRLQVSSDDPPVLSWPWEALYDPEVGHLAHTCQIERRLNKVRDPQPLPDRLPAERVNIRARDSTTR